MHARPLGVGAIAVRVVPSMTLTSDKRRAQAGAAFAISGTLAPRSRRRVSARAPDRLAPGRRCSASGSTSGRALRDHGPAEEGRLYRVSIIAEGVTGGAPCARGAEVLQSASEHPE